MNILMKLIKESLAVLGALCLLAGCSTNLDIKKLGDPSSYMGVTCKVT